MWTKKQRLSGELASLRRVGRNWLRTLLHTVPPSMQGQLWVNVAEDTHRLPFINEVASVCTSFILMLDTCTILLVSGIT